MCVWVCGVGEGKELGRRFKRHVRETNNNDEITLEKELILVKGLRMKLSP